MCGMRCAVVGVVGVWFSVSVAAGVGTTLGVDGRSLLGNGVGRDGPTLGDDVLVGTVVEKMWASWCRASICWLPKLANGEEGLGCSRACIRAGAALRAASADDVLGMVVL